MFLQTLRNFGRITKKEIEWVVKTYMPKQKDLDVWGVDKNLWNAIERAFKSMPDFQEQRWTSKNYGVFVSHDDRNIGYAMQQFFWELFECE